MSSAQEQIKLQEEDDRQRKIQEDEEKQNQNYKNEQNIGLQEQANQLGIFSVTKDDLEKYNNAFFLSKFNVNKESSTITPYDLSLNINEMQLFDNGTLHSLDVFKMKASVILSDLRMQEINKIKNGSITEVNGLSYSIFTNNRSASFSGNTNSFNSLQDAIGSEGIEFLRENQLPFVIVWTGYVISDKTGNLANNYDFLGTSTNVSNNFSLKVDQGNLITPINITNGRVGISLFNNRKYPIDLIYISSAYKPTDNITFKINNSNNKTLKLHHLKENNQVYEPKYYYFGIVNANNLYKFYVIYDTETNIKLKSYKNVNTQSPNIININYEKQNLKVTISDTTQILSNTIVFLNKLETDFRVNKQFYVNQVDNLMTFVPYNSDFLTRQITTPYVLAGKFAPPTNIVLNNTNSINGNMNDCAKFCTKSNCSSYYSYVQSIPYTKEIKTPVVRIIDASVNRLIPTQVTTTKTLPNTTFELNKKGTNIPKFGAFNRTTTTIKDIPTLVNEKKTKNEIETTYVTRYRRKNKCIINRDNNENIVPLDKMNSIQPESRIRSSNLYIQNKKFAMSKSNMPSYVPTRNDQVYYNINGPSNYTQGFEYEGRMSQQTPIGKHRVPAVKRLAQNIKTANNTMIKNNMQPFSNIEGFSYDGIDPGLNSVDNKLSSINELNIDILNNINNIDSTFADLSGNCGNRQNIEEYNKCIKYRFSTDPKANIVKKITDKNDAYAEDLTEVKLQQNNIYVLGAITTASLLIFAIMLAR